MTLKGHYVLAVFNVELFFCTMLRRHLVTKYMWGYHGGSPTAVQARQPCPLWEPSPSHPILL